ncbi:protein phosphatase 1 regulatory subunit 27-like [Mizuhopecten yessoensis]|uniref:Protein phosphatase 1 regulatory subunit 27 n=1 Tax=Mizuhopecten yessoensis TaxID=6573 RepID=A0A210PUR1_MIZYE|nr:protein phosphatase 1 regulatory subunit 27-like [Mizuhopecten yessoensis]XP_021374793.1 protein phosphatase 1 regulatory subunit 27-like [Mizuhopecten yessoensis]XP_021374794.1 protein phosphatase 1 regulatory subunit 27-like [Mizuhopecten yessoensis]OWF40230.1 Protein phosphatase 1 regulatory subunit 27 [Mizuhopecten yessoensis]
MSRRASLYAKQNPGKSRPKVHFPDELVFLDNIKENDIQGLNTMLRRASLQVDISGINDAGLTPLHQAVLDGNMMAVRLLIEHGANVNKQDEDSWSPLHAACAEGHADIAKLLLQHGAKKDLLTEDGERPLDLVEPTDFPTIKVMLGQGKGNASPPPPDLGSDDSEEESDDDK